MVGGVDVPAACQYPAVSAQIRRDLDPKTLRARLEKHDPFWGPQLVIAAAIMLQFSLSDKVTVKPSWLIPALEALALLGLIAASPHPQQRHSPLRRRLSLTLIAIVSAANITSLVLLCHYLLQGGKTGGRPLIG